MAKTTSEIYNKIMEITKLTHELSNDLEQTVTQDKEMNMRYASSVMTDLVNLTNQVNRQIKYKDAYEK